MRLSPTHGVQDTASPGHTMQISRSLIPQSYPLPLEPQWEERTGQVAPFVPPGDSGAVLLTRRPVANIEQAEQLYLRHRYPETTRLPPDDLRSRRALAAYESVQLGAQRENLRSLLGVDEYA